MLAYPSYEVLSSHVVQADYGVVRGRPSIVRTLLSMQITAKLHGTAPPGMEPGASGVRGRQDQPLEFPSECVRQGCAATSPLRAVAPVVFIPLHPAFPQDAHAGCGAFGQ